MRGTPQEKKEITIMIKVLNKKGKVLMEVRTVQKAYEGLRKGTYKVGEYSVIEPNGKVHEVIKYRCVRKSRKDYVRMGWVF
jgi:hypothetical protein